MGSASAVVAPVSAQSRAVGHLRVVDAPKFSALPHVIMRDTSLSCDARLLYAVLQSYWWQEGECWASHATLAADLGCGLRSLRTYLDELIEAGVVAEKTAGIRRQKVYAPTSNTSKLADCPEVNRQKTTVQSAKNDTSNTSKLADSKKKTPEKKTQEEDVPPTGVGAAVAATMPSEGKPAKRASRIAADIELSAAHIEAAEKIGLSRADIDAQWARFVDYWRGNGKAMVDWMATWRNWCRKSSDFAPRPNRTYGAPTRTNGMTAPKPPAADAPKWNRREY